MTLIEALKSGKRFRIWHRNWYEAFSQERTGKIHNFTCAEILSNLWEIEPELKKKITRWLWVGKEPSTQDLWLCYFGTEEEVKSWKAPDGLIKIESTATDFEEQMKRKIIQITTVPETEDRYPILIALCADNTLWKKDLTYPTDSERPWLLIEDIPDAEDPLPISEDGVQYTYL